MDILHREILDLGQTCYVMIASVNDPQIYLRFQGKVLNRWIKGENIGYYVHIEKVLESATTIRDLLHRSKHRVFSITSERGQIKKIDCFDLLQHTHTFNANFKDRYKDYTWYLPAVFVFTNEEDLEIEVDKASKYLHSHLTKSLSLLEERINRNNE